MVLLRRLLIVLVVLVALFVAADRLGVYVAESVAADNLKKSQHLSSSPDVSISGFPFLTQLADGDFDQITVDAKGLPVGRAVRELRIADLHVVLHGVHVSHSFSRVEADRADATATISYVDLGRALGVKVTYVGSGRVRATASVSVLGRTVGGSVTARPELHGTSLGFGNSQVDGAGSAAAELANVLQKVFAVDIPFSGIPFQVRLDSVQATPAGLQLALTGRHLSYVKS